MLVNNIQMRHDHDHEQYENVRDNRGNGREGRNRGDDIGDHEGWFRNSRIVLLYFFAAFVIIRIWILVVATENKLYISVSAIAMGVALVFYLRWRRRYVMMLREDYANRQQDREISTVTIQEFLNIQAAMRAAQNGGTVISAGSLLPNNMPLLIAALPSIVYVPPVRTTPMAPYAHQGSVSGFTLGASSVGSNKVVPTVDVTEMRDIESGEREAQAPLCMVCLGNFIAGDVLTCLPCACGHQYHRLCLISWLERKTTCPLCAESVAAMLLGPTPVTGTDVRTGPERTIGTGTGQGNGGNIGGAAVNLGGNGGNIGGTIGGNGGNVGGNIGNGGNTGGHIGNGGNIGSIGAMGGSGHSIGIGGIDIALAGSNDTGNTGHQTNRTTHSL